LPRIVGAKRALALMLTAEQVSAEDAERMGLVYKVYDDALFMTEARALAERMAAGPSATFRMIKEAVRASSDNDLQTQLNLERDLQRQAGASQDFGEGVAAFLAKRPPRFSGK
jgi:2-(1,2-epoxy-1,2-dihydrophenyl)acetyl-CoA isomerase